MMTLDTAIRVSGQLINYNNKRALDPLTLKIQEARLNLAYLCAIFVL
jgi:hypothetical protein